MSEIKEIKVTLCPRSDTKTNWESKNYTLAKNEIGIDTTSHNFKVGDGVTKWNSLPYYIVDTKYTLPLATNGTRGGIQIGYQGSDSNKNYPVLLDNEKAYVHVPWTDSGASLNKYSLNITAGNTTSTYKASDTSATKDVSINLNNTYLKLKSNSIGEAVQFKTSGFLKLNGDGDLISDNSSYVSSDNFNTLAEDVSKNTSDIKTINGQITTINSSLTSIGADIDTLSAQKLSIDDITIPSSEPTLAWGSSTTIATISKNNTTKTLSVKMPANPNTHYTTMMYIGATNVKSNAATTNGNTYLKLYDDSTKRSEFNIKGTGATTVVSDANGNITINSSNTNTTYSFAEGTTNGAFSVTPSGGSAISVKVHNVVTYNSNANIDVAGTSKTVSKLSPETLFVSNGLIMGGTAAAAGLVTRGICGVSTPDSTGGCTKENLYLNYDGDNDYSRKVILGADSTGNQIGTTGAYQYAAVRGDQVEKIISYLGYAKGSFLPLSGGTLTGILNVIESGGHDFDLSLDGSSGITIKKTISSGGSGSGKFQLQVKDQTTVSDVVLYLPSENNNTLATQEWVNNKGYTTNTGTVTSVSVKMNNTVKGTVTSSGTIDLGTVITSHQSIKKLKTDNTIAQTPSASEDIAGSGTINLHKVSKTGSYTDLNNKPTIPDVSNFVTLNTAQTITGIKTFNAPALASGEQSTTIFKTANGGQLIIGKEGPNSGTMLAFDQTSGTRRLTFRATATAGAMVWSQPEANSSLYYDVNNIYFRTVTSINFSNFKNGLLKVNASGTLSVDNTSYATTTQLENYIPLAGSSNIAGNLVPKANNTYNLGDATHTWNTIWATELIGENVTVGEQGTLFIGQNEITASAPTSGIQLELPSQSGTIALKSEITSVVVTDLTSL